MKPSGWNSVICRFRISPGGSGGERWRKGEGQSEPKGGWSVKASPNTLSLLARDPGLDAIEIENSGIVTM